MLSPAARGVLLERVRGGADLVQCTFEVRVQQTEPGDTVLLVGSGRAMGDWNVCRAIALKQVPHSDVWRAQVDIPVGNTIEFKFAIFYPTGTLVWEPFYENRSAVIPDAGMRLLGSSMPVVVRPPHSPATHTNLI